MGAHVGECNVKGGTVLVIQTYYCLIWARYLLP